MLTLVDGVSTVHCKRREFLRVGAGIAATGLVLPDRSLSAGTAEAVGGSKSCILVYLLGGPPHQDMFDLKPDAPAEIRGPFQPIDTNVPGVRICEQQTWLA